MANRFWIGNGGNWNDTSHWSTTSGGAGGASYPGSNDNAYFDVNSFTVGGQTVTQNVIGGACADMVWTGALNTPTFRDASGYNFSLFGSLTLIANMLLSAASGNPAPGFNLLSTATGKTITTAGRTLHTFTFSGVGGGWTLQDSFLSNASFTLTNGTLNTNGQTVTCGYFSSSNSNTRVLTLGASTINCNTFDISITTGLTFNANTSTIIASAFNGGGLTYYNFESSGSPEITGNNTFNKLTVPNNFGIRFANSSTQTVTTDVVMGTSATLSASVSANLVFNGTSATALGTGAYKSNITVTMSNAVHRYWMGNSGNWSDISHWSGFSNWFTGASAPVSTSNAYFNAYSFTSAGQTVTQDVSGTCLDMIWTGATNTPTYSDVTASGCTVYGSLTLISAMSFSGAYAGNFVLASTSGGKTITTVGKTCYWLQVLGVGGGWTLQDDIATTVGITLRGGTLNTNGKAVIAPTFDLYNTGTRVLTLGASIVTCSTAWTVTSATGLTLNANTSTIRMTGNNKVFTGGALSYYNLEFSGSSTSIVGNNTFNKITVSPSCVIRFTAASTQTVTTDIVMGNSSTINSLTPASNANLVFNGATVTPLGTSVTKTDITVTTPSAPANKRYWVSLGGNWSDVAHWSSLSGFFGGFTVPTATFSAYFDANSFTSVGQTVIQDVVGNCLDMIWTGVANSPTYSDTTASGLNIYGSLILVSGMTVSGANGGTFTFTSTSSGKTITTASKTLYSCIFNGVSGVWTLQDSLTLTSILTLTSGTLNTNNVAIVTPKISITGTSARTLTLGSSAITLNGASITSWDATTTTNLTFTANTATINLTGNTSVFAGGGLTAYRDLTFTGTPISISGNNTFNKITIAPSSTLRFTASSTQTVTTDFVTGASSVLNSLTPASNANLVFNGTSVTPLATGVTKTDITVTTPNAPANKRYWMGNTGNWNDTVHWSNLSGFFTGAVVPTSADSAYFNAYSFTIASQIVTVNVSSACLDVDWTGVLNTPQLAITSALAVYGSLTFIPMMTVTGASSLTFKATTSGKTINTSALSLPCSIVFDGVSGVWTLQNTLINTNASGVAVTNGSFITGNNTINTTAFASSNANIRTITLGSSVITCTDTTTPWNLATITNLTFSNNTATINLTGATGTFDGGGLTNYYNVSFQGTTASITGNNTFNKLTIGASKTLRFTASSTQTSLNLDFGISSTLNSLTPGSNANLVFTGTSALISYTVTVTDITTTAPNAPANERHWIGDSGNWNDINHWSIMSGFLKGASVPSATLSVFFDANSFTLVGQTVTMNVLANCLDMNWTGALNTPTWSDGGGYTNVYGSLTLISGMTVSGAFGGYVEFKSTSVGKTITTASKTMNGFAFTGIGGGWTLQDGLTVSQDISVSNGSFISNNQAITCRNFNFNYATLRTITLGSSIVTCSGFFGTSNLTNLTFNVGTSTIKMTGATQTFYGGGLTYYNVEFQGTPNIIDGSNTFNKITVLASKTLRLTASSTQTVTTDMVFGNSSTLNSLTPGSNANLVFNGTTFTPLGTSITKTDVTVTAPNAPANKKYWVLNSGNWNDTAHWSVLSGFFGGAVVPSSADSVYFDASSFSIVGQTMTINATANCLDMIWTGVINAPTMGGASNLSIYGSFTTPTNITITYGGFLSFKSTTSGKTITTNGVVIPTDLYFNGVGGVWTLQDNLTLGATNGIQLDNGTLSTNGKTLNCNFLNSNNTNIRTLTLGSSTINLSGTLNFATTTNLTFTANTATIKLTGNTSTFAGGSLTYYNVELTGTPSTISGSNTFNQLKLTAAKTVNFTAGTTQTVAFFGAIGSVGNLVTMQSTSSGTPYTITKASGTYNVNYCSIKDCTISTVTMTAYNSTNVSGNTGITFAGGSPVVGKYWVGNGGNWSDFANHWADISGGVGGTAVPNSSNNVYFDANSFNTGSQTVTQNIYGSCLDMIWTGSLNTPTWSDAGNGIEIYGNLTLISGMTVSGANGGSLNFRSTSTGKTITTVGKTCYSIAFNGIGGGWTLQDDLTIGAGGVTLNFGHFDTNGKTIVNGGTFYITGVSTRALTLGASTVTNTGGWSASNTTNLTFNVGTSIIKLISASTFNGGSLTYNRVELSGSPITIVGSNSFNELLLTANKTYNFTAGTTQNVKRFSGVGTAGNLVTMQSTSSGSSFFLTKVSGNFVVNYCSIKDCSITATTMTAYNSTNVSGNTNVSFVGGSPNVGRYWVDDSGAWSSTGHWSDISGGVSGQVVPTSSDSVYFDINSFTLVGQTVTATGTQFSLNLDWTGSLNTPTLTGISNVRIYGSVTFISNMILTSTSGLDLYGVGTHTINTSGISLTGGSSFRGSGTYTLLNGFTSTSSIDFISGTFATGGYPVNCSIFYSSYSNVRTLTLGSSTITCSGSWTLTTSTNMTLTANTSTIKLTGNTTTFAGGSLTTYNIVELTGTPITITGNNTISDLKLTANKTVNLTVGSTQTITTLSGVGTLGNLITLQSTSSGTPATLSRASGDVTAYYYSLKDITATGGAKFYALASTNVSGNTGWLFNSLVNRDSGSIIGQTILTGHNYLAKFTQSLYLSVGANVIFSEPVTSTFTETHYAYIPWGFSGTLMDIGTGYIQVTVNAGRLGIQMGGGNVAYSSVLFPQYNNQWIKLGVKYGELVIQVASYSEVVTLPTPTTRVATNNIIYYGNVVIDEAHLHKTEMTTAEILALSAVETFGLDTRYLAHFDGTLSAGLVTSLTKPIYKYLVSRRLYGATQWDVVREVLASATTYSTVDYLAKNGVLYEYAVFPVADDGTSGDSVIDTATEDFFGWVLVDEDNTYAYKFDLENNSQSVQVVEDLKVYDNYTEMAYVSQGIRAYRVGNLETMPYSINGTEVEVTVTTLNQLKAFINNKKPKYLKNTSGEIYKVMTSEFNYKFIDQIKSQPYKVSFKFIQIGVVE